MRAAFALRMISGKIIYNFAFVALCGARQTPFHGRGRNEKQHLQRRCGKRTLSGSLRSPAVPLSGFAIFPRPGEVVPLRGSLLHLPVSTNKAPPFGGAGTAQAVTERVHSPFCEKNHGFWQSRQAKTKNPHQCLLYRTKDVQNS